MTARALPMDNPAFRALLSLPPVQPSASTALAVPEMPPQKIVTGDVETDAVLWLQEVVGTGNENLIGKALEAVKRIQTPMKELADRYAGYVLRQARGNTMMAALASMGFGELEEQAKRATKKARRRHDALSRFGTKEALWSDTPAEKACKAALQGMRLLKSQFYQYDKVKAAKRFAGSVGLVPGSLSDCLHGMTYWSQLYRLRNAFDGYGDGDPAGQAHDDYCFASLARISPRTPAEALAALEHMEEHDYMGRSETGAILRNLIAGGSA